MRTIALTTLAALLLCGAASAQSAAPERKVQQNVITSTHDPSVRIELPTQVRYVGADRWVLLDIADCELHVFVEADAQKKVQRLYWIQFEAYVPSRPELRHDYSRDRTMRIFDRDLFVRARFGASSEPVRAGSDTEHVRRLLQAQGYTLPSDTINVRFVELLDAAARKELMIIYMEDLSPQGLTAADLMPGGKGEQQWPAIEQGLIERAQKNIKLQPAAIQ
jgi:hypothetical protein